LTITTHVEEGSPLGTQRARMFSLKFAYQRNHERSGGGGGSFGEVLKGGNLVVMEGRKRSPNTNLENNNNGMENSSIWKGFQ